MADFALRHYGILAKCLIFGSLLNKTLQNGFICQYLKTHNTINKRREND